MRLLEILLLLACAALSIRLAAIGRTAGIQWILGMQLLLAVVLITQVLIEGWRWQMFPAYAATLLAVAAPWLFGLTALASFGSAVVTLALLGTSVLACLVFPFVAPQAPSGTFCVGVTTLPISVQRAADVESYELKAPPQVRLWYPAQAVSRSPGLSELLAERVSVRFQAVPALPAAPNGAVAHGGKKFPVVVYFDGWPEDRTQNVNLILELASRGFAVASVTYAGIDRPMVNYSSEADFERSVQLDHARARLHALDAVTVLDALSSLDSGEGDRFAQRLDTEHASALGFSYGGAIAAEASRLDPRIRAAVNLEGRHWGDALEQGVEKPYMFVSGVLDMPSAAALASVNPETRYEARLDQVDYSKLDENLQALGGVRITIPFVAHSNFTDVPLRSPLTRFRSGGKLDARRVQDIVKSYVVEFLLRYGVAVPSPPFDSPWPHFPEARVQTWPARQAASGPLGRLPTGR